MLHTVAMVTTQAQGKLATIHHRMPLLLDADETEEWLDLDAGLPAWVASTRREPEVEMYAVSPRVNSVRNNDPDLIRPIDAVEDQQRLF